MFERRRLGFKIRRSSDLRLNSEETVCLKSFHARDVERDLDPVQEWGDESDDGVLYSVTLRRIPVEQSQGSFVQYKTIKVRSVKAATLERLVSLLLEPGTDPHFTTVFLSTYRAFTTTQQLLEMVLDSLQRDPLTLQRDPLTLQRDPLTLQRDPLTLQRDPLTLQRDPLTLQRDPLTLQRDPLTLQRDPLTLQRDPLTLQRDPLTLQRDPLTLQRDPLTLQRDPLTLQRDPLTLQRDPLTLQRDPLTLQRDPLTLQRDPLTLQRDPLTLQRDPLTLQRDPLTLQRDPLTLQRDPLTLQRDPLTLQRDPLTLQRDPLTLQRDPLTLQRDPLTLQRDPLTLQRDPLTLQRDPLTLQRDPLTLQRDPLTLQRDPLTLQRDPLTLQRDPLTLQRDPLTLQRDPLTLQRDPLTLQRDPLTLQRDPLTLQRDPLTLQRFNAFLSVCVSAEQAASTETTTMTTLTRLAPESARGETALHCGNEVDLFVKAIPFQCLGCVWSQRDKKENKHLAATIRSTISQFNSITNCVISTLLRQPAPPPVRASVIEKWIQVAQECRALKNLSSLRAILSALQSNSIFRLKKTWAAVSRESLSVFEQLSEMFPGENCSLSGREILLQSPGCGAIPYLGTYLTALTMLDSALPDTVQGGLINFEKRRRECEILSQIRQLQGSCLQYKLNDHPEISSWLRSYKRLSEQKSYDLSQEVEPPVDSYPASTGTWNHRTLAKKMIWLLTGSEGSGSKSSPDLVSLTSSGSNGSETEDLTVPSSPRRAKHMVRPWVLSGSSRDVRDDVFSSSEPSSPLPFPHPLQHRRSASMTSLPVYNQQIDDSCIVRVSVESSNGNLYKSILHRRSASMTSLPVYNQQIDDSCIVRVSVESSNGNLYKSILDKTVSVIQRALQKHNMESVHSEDFQLSQVLPGDKELIIPDKANVFYAMSTSADYNFILKRRRGHKTPPTPTAGWKK
ncbi:UNVERIFIED_CONTAM: hypothetical protein FKN15_077389 [Acipenser sinensis]